MVKLFKKLFIKNYKDTENPKVRANYGTSAGILGIFGNAVLVVIKLIGGILSGSIAVITDAINNLSDFTTSIITLIGFKVSGRPADKEHPYGHARYEYITGLLVACVIIFIGISAGKAAVEKIISGTTTDFSTLTCIILGASVLIKIFMSVIYKGLGKSINSETLYGMSADSRNDSICTFVILISTIIALSTGVSLDGYFGLAGALLVVFSATMLIKDTINPLLGCAPEKELVKRIEQKLRSYPEVLDFHDLIVHTYGHTKTFATVHVEVDANGDVMISHDLVDNIERDFFKDMNIMLVEHLDPVDLSNPETVKLKEDLFSVLKDYNSELSLHDFRVVKGNSHTNVIFDVVVPFGQKNAENEIRKIVNDKLATYDKVYYAVIEFDTDFNG